jgi:transcriptional regulator with GAF, ATPase, and Fis domain
VAVDCGAIAESLMEAAVPGMRSAFTGASGARRELFGEATGGTMFLDDRRHRAEDQGSSLRALRKEIRRVGESRVRVDVRIVAATNKDLKARVADRRLGRTCSIASTFAPSPPPLRERQRTSGIGGPLRGAARGGARPVVTEEAMARLAATTGRATCGSWRTWSRGRWR